MLSRTAESLKLVKAGLRTESRLNGSSPTYRRTHSPGHFLPLATGSFLASHLTIFPPKATGRWNIGSRACKPLIGSRPFIAQCPELASIFSAVWKMSGLSAPVT